MLLQYRIAIGWTTNSCIGRELMREVVAKEEVLKSTRSSSLIGRLGSMSRT